MVKVNIKPRRVFTYIKDKATCAPNLPHGEDIPANKLIDTDWKDFEDPIVGTFIPNFFITYFGQDLPHGDLMDEEIMAKLVRLGSGYELLLIPPKLPWNASTTSSPSSRRSKCLS